MSSSCSQHQGNQQSSVTSDIENERKRQCVKFMCNVMFIKQTYAEYIISYQVLTSYWPDSGRSQECQTSETFKSLDVRREIMASKGGNHENCRTWLASVMPKNSLQDFQKDKEKTEEQLFIDLKDGKILCRLLQFLTKEELIIKNRYVWQPV